MGYPGPRRFRQLSGSASRHPRRILRRACGAEEMVTRERCRRRGPVLTAPGYEVDFHLASSLRTLTEAWMGDLSLSRARDDSLLEIHGARDVQRRLRSGLKLSPFGGVRRQWPPGQCADLPDSLQESTMQRRSSSFLFSLAILVGVTGCDPGIDSLTAEA